MSMDDGMEIEEEMDESFDDFEEDDFDPDLDPDMEDDDLSIDEVEGPSYSGKKSKDKYADVAVESAIVANPKRVQARKKAAKVIGGIISSAELSTEDGQAKAWKKLSQDTDGKLAKDYQVGISLDANDAINHKKFGLGFVVEEVSATKVSVLFEDGLRKLVCKNG